jgi:hypothetical protein
MNNINFEADQTESITQTNDAKALSDQVIKLRNLEDEIKIAEESLKQLKQQAETLSSEVIPTMMTEMNISTMKLADGSALETQLKISRKWNSMMASIKMKGKNGMFTPAFFSHTYNLRTTQMSNDKGTWFGWEVSKVGPVQDTAIYQQAKSFAESISKGDVKVKHGESTDSTKSEASHF